MAVLPKNVLRLCSASQFKLVIEKHLVLCRNGVNPVVFVVDFVIVMREIEDSALKSFLSLKSDEGSDWSLKLSFVILHRLVNLLVDILKL